jgi:hypothetical protein
MRAHLHNKGATMMNHNTEPGKLKANFLETSTISMPMAGMIYWAVVGIAGFIDTPLQLAYGAALGSGLIFPLAILIDRLRAVCFAMPPIFLHPPRSRAAQSQRQY